MMGPLKTGNHEKELVGKLRTSEFLVSLTVALGNCKNIPLGPKCHLKSTFDGSINVEKQKVLSLCRKRFWHRLPSSKITEATEKRHSARCESGVLGSRTSSTIYSHRCTL